MKLYKSDGKIFAELDETIELCNSDCMDTLEQYKRKLIEKIGNRFDWAVKEARLMGMQKETFNKKG